MNLFSSLIYIVTILVVSVLLYFNVSLAELSISITSNNDAPYTTWAIGRGYTDTVYIMTADEYVKISNDGTVTSDYKLQVTSPGSWSYSSVTNSDQCILMGLFAADNGESYTPSEGQFSTLYDIIDESNNLTATINAGDGKFEGAGSGYNGYSVGPGESKKLYFYLKTPSSVSSGGKYSIGITIEAIAH
ncbi:hypothetical protein GMMP1_140046 [Candidatus Magnetomoraceae bacterium gMMP-1]